LIRLFFETKNYIFEFGFPRSKKEQMSFSEFKLIVRHPIFIEFRLQNDLLYRKIKKCSRLNFRVSEVFYGLYTHTINLDGEEKRY
jgi:hypothetical protein